MTHSRNLVRLKGFNGSSGTHFVTVHCAVCGDLKWREGHRQGGKYVVPRVPLLVLDIWWRQGFSGRNEANRGGCVGGGGRMKRRREWKAYSLSILLLFSSLFFSAHDGISHCGGMRAGCLIKHNLNGPEPIDVESPFLRYFLQSPRTINSKSHSLVFAYSPLVPALASRETRQSQRLSFIFLHRQTWYFLRLAFASSLLYVYLLSTECQASPKKFSAIKEDDHPFDCYSNL